MPPVAAVRAKRPNGQTPRNGQDRSLQTCRKFASPRNIATTKICHPVGAVIDRPAILRSSLIFPAGWGHLALRGNKIISRGRGGACPARGITETAIYRVICRHGYYAARGQTAVRKSRVGNVGRGLDPSFLRLQQHNGQTAFLRKMHKLPHHILFDSTKMFFMGLQPLLLYSNGCIMES